MLLWLYIRFSRTNYDFIFAALINGRAAVICFKSLKLCVCFALLTITIRIKILTRLTRLLKPWYLHKFSRLKQFAYIHVTNQYIRTGFGRLLKHGTQTESWYEILKFNRIKRNDSIKQFASVRANIKKETFLQSCQELLLPLLTTFESDFIMTKWLVYALATFKKVQMRMLREISTVVQYANTWV